MDTRTSHCSPGLASNWNCPLGNQLLGQTLAVTGLIFCWILLFCFAAPQLLLSQVLSLGRGDLLM